MRPLGVTLSACFQFVRAALLISLALGIMFAGGRASRLASLAKEGNGVQRFIFGFGQFLVVALLIYALILVILGVGLLVGQHWARFLTIIFSGLGALAFQPRLLHHHPLSLLFAALNLAVLIYLLLPQTGAYFWREKSPGPSPA